MRKYALIVIFGVVIGGVSLSAYGVARDLLFGNERSSYRTLEPDVYYPTFFKRYVVEREHGAAWLRIPTEVALAYVGYTRVCPSQEINPLLAEAGRIVLLIRRVCPYSVSPLKEFRIDLVERDGFWEIEWAGLRYKCAVNQNPVGAYLVNHNPFQPGRAGWAQMLNREMRQFAGSLNPWSFECPPR